MTNKDDLIEKMEACARLSSPTMAVGDKGQRYEVRYFDGNGEEHTMGWTDAADGGGLHQSLLRHPVWRFARIIDRQAKNAADHSFTPEKS